MSPEWIKMQHNMAVASDTEANELPTPLLKDTRIYRGSRLSAMLQLYIYKVAFWSFADST